MSNVFHIKHNMHAIEFKIIALINKEKNLINKLNRNWQHPLIRKYSHTPFKT